MTTTQVRSILEEIEQTLPSMLTLRNLYDPGLPGYAYAVEIVPAPDGAKPAPTILLLWREEEPRWNLQPPIEGGYTTLLEALEAHLYRKNRAARERAREANKAFVQFMTAIR